MGVDIKGGDVLPEGVVPEGSNEAQYEVLGNDTEGMFRPARGR